VNGHDNPKKVHQHIGNLRPALVGSNGELLCIVLVERLQATKYPLKTERSSAQWQQKVMLDIKHQKESSWVQVDSHFDQFRHFLRSLIHVNRKCVKQFTRDRNRNVNTFMTINTVTQGWLPLIAAWAYGSAELS